MNYSETENCDLNYVDNGNLTQFKQERRSTYQENNISVFRHYKAIICTTFTTKSNPLDTEGGPLDRSRCSFVVFSYFLIFWREQQLCKFLILKNLSNHLFGLVFSGTTSDWGPLTLPLLLNLLTSIKLVLRWGFLKPCFLKTSYKMLLWHLLYMKVNMKVYKHLENISFLFYIMLYNWFSF